MKKCLLLSFSFMACVAFAQPKIHSITAFKVGKEKQKTVQLFDYQDNGLTVKQQTWDYKRVDSTPRLIAETNQRFTNDKQLVSQEMRDFASVRHRSASRIDNKFDAKGCQIEYRSASLDTNNKETRVFLTFIETNNACRVTKETLRQYTLLNGQLRYDSFEIVKTFQYDNRDSLKKIVFDYFYKGLISNTFPQGFIEYTRRADGKVTEIYEADNCQFCVDLFGSPMRHTFDYNALGQVVTEKNFATYRTPLQLRDSTVFMYNSANKLSRETKFFFDGNNRLDFKYIFDYDYYCDNLLKSETMSIQYQNYPEGNGISKKIYTYTEGANCDKKDLVNFTISPNPVSFYASIVSEALLSADYTVSIYNLAGALIQTYKIDFRTTQFDFSTAHLISGAYLVRLTNEKNSVTKKLIVVH